MRARTSRLHPALPLLTPIAAALLALSAGAALASGVPVLQVVTVRGEAQGFGIANSATEGSVSAEQIATRPLLRAAELVETIPGMIVTQHSGDGKANQYFLRGFNLDHGSDFATQVGGMPVNVASHAHGQGYMDLNFVIPELVASVRYRKGVYAVEDGDFSNTGSARISYQRRVDAPYVDLTAGPHHFRRVLAAGSTELAGHQVLAAVEGARNDGPWDQPEDLHKVNALVRVSRGTAANGYALSAMSYRSRWTATEHVPERAIASGEIGRFGALSAHDGGVTARHSLSGEWASGNDAGAASVSGYVAAYRLNLFSAPSGFIDGPDGDQHEQADRRVLWGGQARRAWYFGHHELEVGAQLRQDRIDNLGLYRTVDRVRTATIRQDEAVETSAALFAAVHSEWTPWLRTSLGARYDRLRAHVSSTGGALNAANGGKVSDAQASPKVSVVLSPFGAGGHTELFANWGYGFHSNDARGATSSVNPADGSPATPLALFARAIGAEAGLRTQPLPGWTSSVSLWRMTLASELVFVGDEGVTEPRGGSRREGIEWSNYLTPAPGIIIDADLALSKARFTDAPADADRVPNAVPLTASVGIGYDAGGAWFGGLRARYIGAYSLEESGREKSRALPTLNGRLGYRVSPGLQLSLDVLNLFDRKGNDIEYWGGACTRREQDSGACGGGIDGRLVHPLEPRTLRVSLRQRF
ncbi:MAG: TonB-dependent receptor [Gammaproteobacteria bacterium]